MYVRVKPWISPICVNHIKPCCLISNVCWYTPPHVEEQMLVMMAMIICRKTYGRAQFFLMIHHQYDTVFELEEFLSMTTKPQKESQSKMTCLSGVANLYDHVGSAVGHRSRMMRVCGPSQMWTKQPTSLAPLRPRRWQGPLGRWTLPLRLADLGKLMIFPCTVSMWHDPILDRHYHQECV